MGRENDDSVVMLDTLEKMSRFRVRVSVIDIVDGAACPKQDVGFVEEEDRATRFCFIKYVVQILLRLADVLAHHRRHIHPEQLYVQCFGQHLGGLPSAEGRGTGQDQNRSRCRFGLFCPAHRHGLLLPCCRSSASSHHLVCHVFFRLLPVG
jgi:hypothetical protein